MWGFGFWLSVFELTRVQDRTTETRASAVFLQLTTVETCLPYLQALSLPPLELLQEATCIVLGTIGNMMGGGRYVKSYSAAKGIASAKCCYFYNI